MKKIVAKKIIRFLMNWLRARFARRAAKHDKPRFGAPKAFNELPSRPIHLLKVARLLKNNFRRTT